MFSIYFNATSFIKNVHSVQLFDGLTLSTIEIDLSESFLDKSNLSCTVNFSSDLAQTYWSKHVLNWRNAADENYD